MPSIFSKSITFLALLSLVFLSLTQAQKSTTDSIPAPDPEPNYISGGTPVNSGEFSHAASLVFRANMRQYCSGTLINATFILTAAHCLFTGSRLDDPSWSGVAIGFKTISENGRVNVPLRSISRMWVHPDYIPNDISRNSHDVALLELSTPVQEAPAIILPSQAEYRPFEQAGMSLVVAGWGSTPSSASSDELLQTEINLFNEADCRSLLAAGGYNANNMICGTGRSIRDACQGDSGAAAGVRTERGFVPVGIVSFGRGECGSTSLGGYTRVSAYLQYIDAVMQGFIVADSQSSSAGVLQCSIGVIFTVAIMTIAMLF